MSKSFLTRQACAILTLAFAGFTCAAPLEVGETAPEVTLSSLEGQSVSIGGSSDERTVLVVLRGFPGYQCPLCSRQVAAFRSNAADFAASGARVVMVYPGGASALDQRANEFADNLPEGSDLPDPMTLVLDPDYQLINAYGLRWDAPNETAYPSTYVLSRSGVVLWSKVSDSHGGRTTAREVLDALE